MVLPYINMHPPRVYTCSPSWTPLPPPSPYHPSGSTQCTSPKLLVSCVEPGLEIRFLYDIIHVLMAFSQIIPTSSPTESKRLFYTSMSLLLSRIQFLNVTFWLRDSGSMTFFWLVDGKLTGQYSRNLNHQSSGSDQFGFSTCDLVLHHSLDIKFLKILALSSIFIPLTILKKWLDE